MSRPQEAPNKTVFQKLLDLIEKLGNQVPHPAVLFLILMVAVAWAFYVLQRMGVSVTYQRSQSGYARNSNCHNYCEQFIVRRGYPFHLHFGRAELH